MQRIFARRLVLKLSDDSCSLQACRTFTSVTKPVQTSHRNLLFPVHLHCRSWESRRRFAESVYGFLSTPEIAKQFSMGSSNTVLRASRQSIADFRVSFLRGKMSGPSFRFNPRFENYSRRWQCLVLRLSICFVAALSKGEGEKRSWFRRLTAKDMVLGLIITNVAVFVLWRIADYRFMSKNFTISLDNVKSGRVHTMITSSFSHVYFWHIVYNMIALYYFGMNIGRRFGPVFLLKLYLAGALGGSVFFLGAMLTSSSQDQILQAKDPSKAWALGASGAVYAIVLLDMFLFPKSTISLEFLIPVPKLFPAIWIGIAVLWNDLSIILKKDSHIREVSHLGGAVVAALAWTRLRRGRF